MLVVVVVVVVAVGWIRHCFWNVSKSYFLILSVKGASKRQKLVSFFSAITNQQLCQEKFCFANFSGFFRLMTGDFPIVRGKNDSMRVQSVQPGAT